MTVKTRGRTPVTDPFTPVPEDDPPGADATPDSGRDVPAIDGQTPAEHKRSYSRTVFADVPLDALDSAEVPEAEWGSHPLTGGAARSEAQLKIDAQVKDLHEKWVAAGRPEIRQSPRKRFKVAPEHGPAVRHMLGKAGSLLDVHVKITPAAHDQEGREVIVYTARDRVRKPRATETPAVPAISSETIAGE